MDFCKPNNPSAFCVERFIFVQALGMQIPTCPLAELPTYRFVKELCTSHIVLRTLMLARQEPRPPAHIALILAWQ